MYSEQNRAFNCAVLASIVLHGLLLFGVSQRERARPAQPQAPIIARLVEPPTPAPAAAPAQVEPERPRPRPKPAPPKPLAREKPAPQAEPAAEPQAEEPVVAQMESVAPAPAPAAPSVIPTVDPAPQTPAPAAEPLADPGSLAKYRQQLITAAPRYKAYPPVARDNNWEGTVALRMLVSPNGRIASLSVTKTSGYDVLDEQALEMFRKAAATVPVPPVLRGKAFAVEHLAATYFFTD